MTATATRPSSSSGAPPEPPEGLGATDRADRRGPGHRAAGARSSWPTVAGVLVLLALVSAVAAASALVSPVAPLGVAVVAGLAVLVWARPLVGAVLVAAVVPATAGIELGSVAGLKISQLLLVLCAGAVLLRRPRRWRAVTGTDLALLLFTVTAIALALLHVARGDTTVTDTLRLGLQPAFLLLAWWTASRGVETRAEVLLVLRWSLALTLVPAGTALLQYLDVPGVRAGLFALAQGGLMPQSGDAGSRVTGPFPIWHSLDGYLLLPTVIAFVLVLRGDSTVLRRPLLWTVLVVDAAAIVLSVTVTILIWLPFAVLVAALLARRLTRAVAVLSVLGVAAVLAFPTVLSERLAEQSTQTEYTAGGVLPQTLQYRVFVWERDYLPVLKEAAAVGIGTDTPSDAQFAATENQNLTYALRGGIGLLATSWVALGALLVRALRQARAPGAIAPAAAMAVAGVVLFLPASTQLWPYISNAGLPQALFGIAGAALALPPARRALPRRFGEPERPGLRRPAPAPGAAR